MKTSFYYNDQGRIQKGSSWEGTSASCWGIMAILTGLGLLKKKKNAQLGAQAPVPPHLLNPCLTTNYAKLGRIF